MTVMSPRCEVTTERVLNIHGETVVPVEVTMEDGRKFEIAGVFQRRTGVKIELYGEEGRMKVGEFYAPYKVTTNEEDE